MRRAHVIAVLALTLSATVLPAVSTTAAGDPPTVAPSERAGDRALDRADAALDGIDAGRQDATLALRDLARALPSLDPAERRRARALLARPTSPSDPFGDSYRAPSKRTCSPDICVHWVSRTSDAPPSRAWVTRTMDVMKQTWSREVASPDVGSLGYRRPARDGERGGDARFDVYLKDVGASGLFGYCAPERTTLDSKWAASGYCVLDDDFARSQFDQQPILSLKATAAHEFFHAVQFAYDYAEDGWFMEATATWMEERVFDEVNDNRRYLPFGQLGAPQRSLDVFQNAGGAQYGNWAFFEYLSGRFGNEIVRDAWQRAAAVGSRRGDYSLEAVEAAVPVGFPRVFGEYAASNTAPSLVYPEGRVYPEGGQWPAAPTSKRRVLSDADRRSRGSLVVNHLASKNVLIKPGAGIGPGWQLEVTVDGPSGRMSPVANVLVHKLDGTVERTSVTLDGDGVLVDFDVRRVTITLANASTRFDCWHGTAYSCRGIATDDARPFSYLVRAVPG